MHARPLAQASYGASDLLLSVLACVLGGIDPAGGRVIGLLVAVILANRLLAASRS